MGRVAASGSLNMYDVKNTLGTPGYDLNSQRRGNGAGSTPPSGTISLGHMYGAFTLGGATIGTIGTSTYCGDHLASTSPVPGGLSGDVGNPGQGYYTSFYNLTGGAGHTIYCPSGENLRTYCRIITYQVPWASFFEASSSSGLGIGHGSSVWPGSISYINGIWFSYIGCNGSTGSYFNNIAIATIKSTSDYAGAIWSDGSTVYFGQLNVAQFASGSFSATWSAGMYSIGSWARNSQTNHYYRWGGTGITFMQYRYNQIGYRGFGYNHDTSYLGPGSQASPNNYGFLKTGGVTAPGSHNGPGGGTVVG